MTIELDEQVVGSRNEVVVVGQIVVSQAHTAYQFGHKFRPIPVRKRVEFGARKKPRRRLAAF